MLFYPQSLSCLFAALVLDALLGDPDWLWRRLPHPVVWIGKLISFLDRSWNHPEFSVRSRKILGVAVLLLLLVISISVGLLLHRAASLFAFGDGLVILFAAVMIAQKSLYQHVAAVRDALETDGLEGGRKAVSMIVGRDPKRLDEAGVCRAAIESCAENFSDGIAAPVFWFALAGLPGLFAYKAINTADSMIGHKTGTYLHFGWASARPDDLVNLPASRLSGLLFAAVAPLVGGAARKAFDTVRQDAAKHRSPNAGWPEAAMAGALDLALAGPRIYPGYTVDDPYMNAAGRKIPVANDIARALQIMLGACVLMALLVLLGAILL